MRVSSRAVPRVGIQFALEWSLIAIYAVCVVGFFINSRSIWLDEAISVFVSSHSYGAMASILQHVDAVHSLYYAILHLWLGFGHSAIVIRLLSAILALLCLPVVAALSRDLFGKETSPASVAVLVTSALFISYAEEARSIALTLLTCACASLMFVRATNDSRAIDVVLFALSSILAIYSNVLSIFFVAALLVSLCVMHPSRNQLRSLALAIVAIGICVVPLALLIHANSTTQIDWIRRSTPARALHFVVNILGGEAGFGRIGFAATVFVASVIACLMVVGVAGNWRTPRRPKVLLIVLWFSVPLAGALLVDHFIHPILIVRYFAFELVPVALLAGAGLVVIKRLGHGGIAYASIGVVAAITVYNMKTIQREDWRSVAALVAREARPGDAIILWAAGTVSTVIPFDYAVNEQTRKIAATVVFPDGPPAIHHPDPPPAFTQQLSRNYATVWLILSHEKTYIKSRDPFDSLARFYPHASQQKFAGIKVVKYQR